MGMMVPMQELIVMASVLASSMTSLRTSVRTKALLTNWRVVCERDARLA